MGSENTTVQRKSLAFGCLAASLGLVSIGLQSCGNDSSGTDPGSIPSSDSSTIDADTADSSDVEPGNDAGTDTNPDNFPDAIEDSAVDATGLAFYGPGIGSDSLDNHQVADVDVDYRFRARSSSPVVSLIWYNIYNINCHPHGGAAGTCPKDCPMSGAVYACGTGGTMHICIQADDGTGKHLSTGVDLGCLDHPSASGPPYLPVETFPNPVPVEAGKLYHIHWHNTDAKPTENFTSVDSLYVAEATVPRQPTVSDTDMAVFRGTTLRPNDTPIFQLNHQDGTVEGQGYIEVWISAPLTISGDSKVRELFKVSGSDRTIRAASVRLNRASGTSALSLTLETAAGTVLGQGKILSSAIPLGDVASRSGSWAKADFGQAITLTSGQEYHLVLSSPADTSYQAVGIERGNNYKFKPPSFFGDGYGQFSTDGVSWQGLNQPGGSTNNKNADLQFYFSD
jgi:hypothetical protein